MKGIILAGGEGRALYPSEKVISKELLPVYDKPMIYYPISTLMEAGIREIIIISSPDNVPIFKKILGNGERFGISLSYAVQEKPEGIAKAFLAARDFVGNDTCALILGDNIFYGSNFSEHLKAGIKNAEEGCATIFSHYAEEPEHYGIVEFDDEGNVLSLEEKPKHPKSNYCATGLYIYDGQAVEKAAGLKPSPNGKYEITDLNRLYFEEGKLRVQVLSRGFAWFDAGSVDTVISASVFVHTLQSSQGIVICCPEEIAYRNSWISREELIHASKLYDDSAYGQYLLSLAEN